MTDYILSLTFDLRQITQALQYEFCTHEGEVCKMLEAGPLAGSFNFQTGDTIQLQVTAIGAMNEDENNPPSNILENISVNDCTLLSLAARMDEPLSMFDVGNAAICQASDKWTKAEEFTQPGDSQKNIKRYRQQIENPLKVVTEKGQWQLSGYLSIQLYTLEGPPLSRLYFFDPESSTGAGGGWQ